MNKPALSTVMASVAIVGLIAVVGYGITRDVQRQQEETTKLSLADHIDEVCKSPEAAKEMGRLCKAAENVQEGHIITDDSDPNDPEIQDPEFDDPEIQEKEVQERENQEPEEQNSETQDFELDDPDPNDPETQDEEIQEPEIQDPENQNSPVCKEGYTEKDREIDHDNDPMTPNEIWLVCVKN